MDPRLELGLLWLAFAATHMALSSQRLRPRLVATLGTRPFQLVYSVVAFAIFVPLVSVYAGHKHAGAVLWALPRGAGLRWTVYVLMGIAFTFVVASLARPSPASVVPGEATVRGIYRITRHPTLMGITLFAAAHLLPNGVSSDVVFFGGFLVFAPLGAWHQDRRKLVDGGAFVAFHARTPFLPFSGRETLTGLRELSPLVVALGIAVAVGVRLFHGSLFGP